MQLLGPERLGWAPASCKGSYLSIPETRDFLSGDGGKRLRGKELAETAWCTYAIGGTQVGVIAQAGVEFLGVVVERRLVQAAAAANASRRFSGPRSNSRYSAGVTVSTNNVELVSPPIRA